MSKLSFKTYQNKKDYSEAKSSLVQHLSESGVDLTKFNQGMQIIQEWGFNPLKTFGKSAATGAGAVLGSALGPVGTALGGMAGSAVGELGSRAVGHAMKGATVQPIQPAYQQAVQAVDALSQMLDAPDVQAVPDAQNLKQNISQVQQSLQGLGNSIAPIDQQRNATLDQNLQAGGGWGAKLRGAQGEGKMAQLKQTLGDKIKNIPILNKDMGLRRAMAGTMDSIQGWATKNPKKAAMLNIGSAIAGGVTGAMGAGALQNAFSSPQQPQAQPQNQQQQPQQPQQVAQSADPQMGGGKHIDNSSATSADAGQYITHSGSTKIGNDAMNTPDNFGDSSNRPVGGWTKQIDNSSATSADAAQFTPPTDHAHGGESMADNLRRRGIFNRKTGKNAFDWHGPN